MGDKITIRSKAKSQGRIQAALALSEQRVPSDWITLDTANYAGSLSRYPVLEDLSSEFNVNLVVELYSK